MRFEIFYKRRRYWASLVAMPDGVMWKFWSDHKWPFYHGHFKQRVIDKDEAYEQFIDWLPFKGGF